MQIDDEAAMIWVAWNNGAFRPSGAGYGFRVTPEDRNRFFVRDWKSVAIELPTRARITVATANIDKDSFWGPQCRELISKQIGIWLIGEKHAPWSQRRPPRFVVKAGRQGRFIVISLTA